MVGRTASRAIATVGRNPSQFKRATSLSPHARNKLSVTPEYFTSEVAMKERGQPSASLALKSAIEAQHPTDDGAAERAVLSACQAKVDSGVFNKHSYTPLGLFRGFFKSKPQKAISDYRKAIEKGDTDTKKARRAFSEIMRYNDKGHARQGQVVAVRRAKASSPSLSKALKNAFIDQLKNPETSGGTLEKCMQLMPIFLNAAMTLRKMNISSENNLMSGVMNLLARSPFNSTEYHLGINDPLTRGFDGQSGGGFLGPFGAGLGFFPSLGFNNFFGGLDGNIATPI